MTKSKLALAALAAALVFASCDTGDREPGRTKTIWLSAAGDQKAGFRMQFYLEGEATQGPYAWSYSTSPRPDAENIPIGTTYSPNLALYFAEAGYYIVRLESPDASPGAPAAASRGVLIEDDEEGVSDLDAITFAKEPDGGYRVGVIPQDFDDLFNDEIGRATLRLLIYTDTDPVAYAGDFYYDYFNVPLELHEGEGTKAFPAGFNTRDTGTPILPGLSPAQIAHRGTKELTDPAMKIAMQELRGIEKILLATETFTKDRIYFLSYAAFSACIILPDDEPESFRLYTDR